MAKSTTEVAVIGAGPGGYVAAIRAAQFGLQVTLIDKSEALGGVCLRQGCIPSKALIHGSELYHTIKDAGAMGITADPKVDLGKMQEWKQGILTRLSRGVASLCKANGVQVVNAHASFTSPTELALDNGDTLTFDMAIIAAGSVPVELPGLVFDGERVLNSQDALSLTSIPSSLTVVGGGYIGLELGTVYAKLGSKVTIVEMMDQIMPGTDPELANVVMRRLRKLGVEVHLGAKADGLSDAGLRVKKGEDTVEVAAERILVAVGRKPNTEGLGLEKTGIAQDERGFITIDDQCRTTVENIFAIGDITGAPMLAHRASAQGKVAAEVIVGQESTMLGRLVPAVGFTDPEIATIGLTEEQAKAEGKQVKVGKFTFRGSGRAMIRGQAEGFVKIVADAKNTVLGVHIAGPEASELINEAALLMHTRGSLVDFADAIHQHPTLAEGLVEAAEAALGRAIHSITKPA